MGASNLPPEGIPLHHIRPYKIFTLLESSPPAQRLVSIPPPNRRGTGGTSLLETFLLLAASRVVKARRLFEFGTFLGSNTLCIALNSPCDAEIFTLDLDEQSAATIEQHPADAPLTKTRLHAPLDFESSTSAFKIKQLRGNSVTFDFSPWMHSIDLCFIDGGHDLVTVKSDTENAFKMAATDRSACILWHDYGNKAYDYSDLTHYLEELSQSREVFHIEDTMTCVWFHDPSGVIVPALLH